MPTRPTSSLDAMFRPRSVAVIGASRTPLSVGHSLFGNLVGKGFVGAAYPVNPSAVAVHSVHCVPDVHRIAEPIDLAIVAVPAAVVPGVIEACLQKGVGAICVISAGFAETGPAGAEAQARLRDACRARGVRLLGPNCMGLVNAEPETRLNATFAGTFPRPGAVSFLSQSGAMGVAVLDLAEDIGLGIRMFASLGNKADVSGNDLLTYWGQDAGTRVILMYLEDFGNPRRFVPIARELSRRVPLICVKSGRTAEGGRAAASHTGALAGQDAAVDVLLEQAGVLRADSIRDMFGVAQALVTRQLPAGPRIAILTNAGGPAILATDFLVAKGLKLAALGADTQTALRGFLPCEASVANPVDMVAAAGPSEWARALPLLLADDNVDLVLTIVVPLATHDADAIADAVFSGSEKGGKPVLPVFLARETLLDRLKRRAAGRHPVYAEVEQAALAAWNLLRVAELRSDDPGKPVHFPVDQESARRRLSTAPPGAWLPSAEALALLADYGLPCTPTRVADSVQAAVDAARGLGGPVALKLDGPAFLHKSDVGGVALSLDGPEAVRAAAERLAAIARKAAPATPWSFLVQRMARPGTELVVGIATDPVFGPLVMVGLGGVFVEILKDVRFGLVPLTPPIVRRMLRRLKSFPLLEGARGREPVDLDAIESALLRLSQLAEEHPEIVELDMNPLVARADGVEVVDARVRVRDASQ